MTRYVAFKPIGVFRAIDDTSGYWTTYVDEDDAGGVWIKDDGSDRGTWTPYDGSENTGTWQNNDNTAGGQWISTTEDPMTIYVALMSVGKFHSVDDQSGYWTTFADEREGGVWITDDGSEKGEWIYDEG